VDMNNATRVHLGFTLLIEPDEKHGPAAKPPAVPDDVGACGTSALRVPTPAQTALTLWTARAAYSDPLTVAART